MTASRERTLRTGGGRLRRLRAILAAGLVLGLGVCTTAATWTDEEQVRAELSAGTVPPPVLTRQCEYIPGVLGLGARVRIFWALPEGYELADVEVRASTSGLGSVLAPLTGFSLRGNTTTLPDDSYRTDVPVNLLGGLLGLGSELEVALVIEDGSWESTSASIASNAGLIAGLGGTCRNLT